MRIAEGLKVVEIGNSAAVAVAGVALADAGAEVVMIEPPGGSALRNEAAFAMWARGKSSVIADLSTPEGRGRVIALLKGADVALLGLKPASLQRFDLDYETLSALAPHLVVGLLTGFGRRGPYGNVPVYDGVMQARGGRMFEFSALAGFERPALAAAPVTAHGASAALLIGVYGALAARERNGGHGQLVETSLLQAQTVYDLSGWAPGVTYDPRKADAPFLPYATARTNDGVWIQFAQNGPELFADYLRVLELDGEYDARELFRSTDAELKRSVRTRIHQQVAKRTWAEWTERLAGERNLSVEKFWAPGEALDHPQFQAIGDVVDVVDPLVGATRQLGPIFDVPSNPLAPQGPAPALGSGAASWPAIGGGSVTPPNTALLSGVTVIELGMWIALPYACTLLADMGARVIKLEPIGGDPMRGSGPAGFKIVQGKETVMIDLKAPGGREIVHRLVTQADVLMHSYRPGVPERLGIDFETLRQINPRLVYLYNGSYGSRGPKSYAPAFHVTGGAVAGGAFAQAGAACPPAAGVVPTADEMVPITRRLERSNEANPDFNSAVMAAAGAVMGLFARERTGQAIAIETRMMLSCAWMMSEYFVDYPGHVAPSLPDAELYGRSARYRLYPTTDGWVFLAVPRDHELARFAEVMGLNSLPSDDGALADVIGAALASRHTDELEALLTSHGVACVRADQGPLATWLFQQAWAHEHRIATPVAASMVGPYTRYGPIVSTAHPHTPGGAHAAGTHTRAVLDELGYHADDVDRLLAAGVVATS